MKLRLHKHPVLRKPGGFSWMTNKLFYRKHQSLFPVLFAGLKTHQIALRAGWQTPAARMKKQHAGGSGHHHTEEGSHGQSPGRTRGLAYREYPACTGLKSKFRRMPSQLSTCYALAGRAYFSSFFNIKLVTK